VDSKKPTSPQRSEKERDRAPQSQGKAKFRRPPLLLARAPGVDRNPGPKGGKNGEKRRDRKKSPEITDFGGKTPKSPRKEGSPEANKGEQGPISDQKNRRKSTRKLGNPKDHRRGGLSQPSPRKLKGGEKKTWRKSALPRPLYGREKRVPIRIPRRVKEKGIDRLEGRKKKRTSRSSPQGKRGGNSFLDHAGHRGGGKSVFLSWGKGR